MTDNDGREAAEVMGRYADYAALDHVSIHVSTDPDLTTLEPNIVAVNDLDILNRVLGTQHETKDDLVAYMVNNKTSAALAIFEAEDTISMPDYINDAVA